MAHKRPRGPAPLEAQKNKKVWNAERDEWEVDANLPGYCVNELVRAE